MNFKIYVWGERILEKWWNREFVFLPRSQLYWQILSDVTIFGTLESIEGLQLPREGLDSKLWLISALSTEKERQNKL